MFKKKRIGNCGEDISFAELCNKINKLLLESDLELSMRVSKLDKINTYMRRCDTIDAMAITTKAGVGKSLSWKELTCEPA